MGRCIVYTGIRLLLLICLFISSCFFLSNFQTLKFFVTLFSGTLRPRRLRRVKHADSEQMYRVYQNQAAAAYLSFYFSFSFLYNFQTLKVYVTLFSGTVRPRYWKLVTHVDNGWMYHVYLMLLLLFVSLFFSFFFFQFSSIKNCHRSFLKNCEAKKVKTSYKHEQWVVVLCVPKSGCCRLFIPSVFHFFLSNFQRLKFFITLFSGTVRPRYWKLVTHVDCEKMYHVYCNRAAAEF